jgi:hypothetical protein
MPKTRPHFRVALTATPLRNSIHWSEKDTVIQLPEVDHRLAQSCHAGEVYHERGE